MRPDLPYLEITGPEGQQFTCELSKERLSIGRLTELNDIAIEPDPQQLVTRMAHCSIERLAGGWWVVDNGSVNKTFLRSAACGRSSNCVKIVEGRASLADGDVILILGKLTEEGKAFYWELSFHDPMKTFRAEVAPRLAYLEYDWIQARLFRVEGQNRSDVSDLRPQEHKLVRYMDQRNRANGSGDEYSVPVMCTYDELIKAIWGDEEFGHTENEINRLVWELRQKVEPDQKEPRFLETVRGLGYRLVTRPLTK